MSHFRYMPIKFQCKFIIFDHIFVISFKQSLLPLFKYFDHMKHPNENFFETYQSIRVNITYLNKSSHSLENNSFEANCVLYLKTDSRPPILMNNGEYNLTSTFDIMLNIFVSRTHNLMVSKSNGEHFKNAYTGYLTQLSTFTDLPLRRRTRSNLNAKNQMVIETCIHIDISVYK